MSDHNGGFFCGALFGAAVGTIIGILIAPRSGEETRAMIADSALDFRDKAMDAYGEGVARMQDRFEQVAPVVQSTTDDLRAKLDLARRKMDEIRANLSDTVNSAAENVGKQVEQIKTASASSAKKAAAKKAPKKAPAKTSKK